MLFYPAPTSSLILIAPSRNDIAPSSSQLCEPVLPPNTMASHPCLLCNLHRNLYPGKEENDFLLGIMLYGKL